MDMTELEAHRLWHIALIGKENKPTDFGAFVAVYGLGNTMIKPNTKNERDGKIDNENKERREAVGKFLRNWADNIEGTT